MTTDPAIGKDPSSVREPSQDQKNIVLLVYILQAAAFVVGITSIAALILAYIKKEDMRGTWLESHINWQIKTFWYGLLGGFIGALLLVVLVGGIILFATAIWVVFRIVKGWLAYSEGKGVPDGLF